MTRLFSGFFDSPSVDARIDVVPRSGASQSASVRVSARRLGPKRFWTARAFQVAVYGGPEWLPARRTKPLSDGRPRLTRASRDCSTDCRLAVRHDSWESIVCHAVETHRFPETVHSYREFIPLTGSLSYRRARARGNHALSNPLSPCADTNVASLLS